MLTVTLTLNMVIAVGAAFWISSLIPGVGGSENLTSMALQQGGLGLILTMLIVSTPPIAAMLFQGTLGQFSPYNAFQPQPQAGSSGNPYGTTMATNHAPVAQVPQAASGRPTTNSSVG